ncbi:MAG: DUF1080 domain-containing protein [Alphaproteobacteria bacterium]|nr:DUF1080 domain-containing protein [Alphaproteobacteria bacterium]
MRTITAACSTLAAAAVIAAFTTLASSQAPVATVLFDGKNIEEWNQIGDANWKIEDGAVIASKGNGFLVSKKPYGDFQLRVEFWADDDVNSGVFIRAEDPQKITGTNAYEVNIFDKRPDPSYATGAIVNVAKVDPMPKAGGKWNTYEITAQGSHLVAVLNGVKTADGNDSAHKTGYIALQHGLGADQTDRGVIKFRKVEIKPL